MVSVAVVGGGLLGSLVALRAAAQGWDVQIFEARSDILSAASAANEGKIHLGPIFALGDADTHGVMLKGALSFASLVDEAIGSALDWDRLVTEPFDYLVMPDSLVGPDELSARYARINDLLEQSAGEWGTRYLGNHIESIVDTHAHADALTGLPAYSTAERAIDPLALCQHIASALATQPSVHVRSSLRVLSLDPDGPRVEVTWRDMHGTVETQRFDFAVNCSWESSLMLVPGAGVADHNFRLKTAVRLPLVRDSRPITLVQGPYGDVVAHRNYTYASWYPTGRLTNSYGRAPSRKALELLGKISDTETVDASTTAWRLSLAAEHVNALTAIGLLPDDVGPAELVGGIIVGHGRRDISARRSPLHSRAEFGPVRCGRVISPMNFKLTTAPLAARESIAVIESAMAQTVLT